MRISKQFALIMVSVLVLACGHAAADEAESDDKGDAATQSEKGKVEAKFADEGDGETTDNAAKSDEGGAAPTEPTTQPRKRSLWEGNTMLFVMLGGVVLLYIFMGRSKRKQAAKRKEMLSSLKKGAKITTIGGIVGTVVEVRDNEVLVKVDETNNARLRLARWAIRGVGDEAKTESPDQRK